MAYLPNSLSLTAADERALIEDYKYFHANPELSLQEFQTTKTIRERAKDLVLAPGIRLEIIEITETATVVILRNGEGKTAAYRADIDALPVLEQSGLAYASRAKGVLEGESVDVMHACGHDTHIAMALKTMEIFARSAEDWQGELEFIFQPAEEGRDGAKLMVKSGLWQKVKVPQVLYGQHVFPGIPGQILTISGPVTAAVDSLKVTLRGKGGHGSQPQDTIDPVVLAAHIVVRLQSIISREVPALESAVITVGSIHAGKKENIIPDTAELRISIRSSTAEIRTLVLAAVERVIKGETLAHGAPAAEIENYHSSNVVMNDEAATLQAYEAISAELGAKNVSFEPARRIMGSEDFGELGDAASIPYSFWFLGGSSKAMLEAKDPISNHSPFFAPQPEVTLQAGVRAALAALYAVVGR